jgi:hypothetical protein
VIQSLPSFASWFSQNQTPSPPVWDLALSLGLPGILAAVSFARWTATPAPVREKIRSIPAEILLLGLWLAVNLVLLYAPFSLQRRLMLGLWIPLAALAAPKIEAWLYLPVLSVRRALAVSVPLFLTSAVSLTILLFAGLTHDSLLFLTRDGAAAADWLEGNARGEVVLASPETSLWLPGMAGVKVVYGHPMETPHADQALQDVEAFFQPTSPDKQRQILIDHRVNWILCTAEEPACDSLEGGSFQEVFVSGNVKVLAVRYR